MAQWKSLAEYELPEGTVFEDEWQYSESEFGETAAKAQAEGKITELIDIYGAKIDTEGEPASVPSTVRKAIRVIREIAGIIFYVVVLILYTLSA